MDERSRPSAGPGNTVHCADQSSSCRSVTGGTSATSVLSMSMASVSSEESVEVFPLAEQEEIAALTHDVRIFKESLEKLRRTFNTVDRDKHEAMRVAAHDRLGDVFRILRTVLEKYPSLHSTELLLTAGTLVQSVKGYNYEDESLESKDILGTIEQLALAFSSRVSEYLMGDFDANFSLSSSVSSAKTKSCENLDSDADSIQDVHIADKKPELLSPQEIDSMLLKLEQGVDFALNRAKLWAKYARDVIIYIERRTHLDLEYAKNLNKLSQTFGPSIKSEPNLPLQSIYCTLLENDAANSIASQATCSLVLGNKYLEPLSARRNEHEQSRKKAKELWHRKLTQMHSAISRVRRARASYQDDQAEWEKTRDALLRCDPSDQQYEKKKLRGDEALQRVLESETGYKACIVDANEKRIQLLKTKTEVVQKTREIILESDAVIKTATVAYFQGQYNLTSMWPHQVKTLCDRSKLYEPGSQYMEFVKRLQPNQTKETAATPFSFDLASNSETSQVLGKERKSTDSLDSEELLCENFYLIDSARSVRNVQDSDTFQNAHLNSSWCRECDLHVNSQTMDCRECGSSCRKITSRTQTSQYGRKLQQEKMSTFGVDLAQHLAETQSSVPLIVCKCVHHINERGKLIKGIYRLSGVKSRVEKLCQEFEQEAESVDLTDVHPNVIASVLKLYLRQLPEPLLTFQLYSDFIQIAKDCPSGSSVDVELKYIGQLTEIVSKLPRAHYLTASHLLHHLQEIAASSALNHMPASNLGIVFGPTVLRTEEGSASLSSLVDTIHQTRVVELLVSHAGEIFGSKIGKASTSRRSSTSLYPNCEIVEVSSTHTQPEENLRDIDSSQPTSKEQSYELTSDEELSYFLLDDQSSSLKASSSSSTPKIFQGSLKDYQGLEGVSLTLLGDSPIGGKSRVQEKLRKTMSASAVDAWQPRKPQKPRFESLGGKPELSQCTGSSADSDYSFESRASSSESTEVFVEAPSVLSHSIEVQCPAALDSQNASNSKQQYSAYIPVYQTHSDSTGTLNIVRTKSIISETKVIRDLLKRQFLDYKEVKMSVPHMSVACIQSSFKKTSFNGSSSNQTNVDVEIEAEGQPSQSTMPTISAESCALLPTVETETAETSPDECVPIISFENDESLVEEVTD